MHQGTNILMSVTDHEVIVRYCIEIGGLCQKARHLSCQGVAQLLDCVVSLPPAPKM